MKLMKLIAASVAVLTLAAGIAHAQIREHILLSRATGVMSEYVSIALPKDQVPQELFAAFDRGTEIEELILLTPQFGADGQPVCYLKYKLDRCFIKSWSTSGDADDRPTEEVAFYYNKIAFAYISDPTVKDAGSAIVLYSPGETPAKTTR